MYTLEDVRLLPDIVTSVSVKLGNSMTDLELIMDTLKEQGLKNDDLIRETFREFFCSSHFLITIGEYFAYELEDLIYNYTLDKIPLYLNKNDDTPEVLQSVIATWRLKMGR